MLRRIAALVGSILGKPASSRDEHVDSSEQPFTIERVPLPPEARVRAFIADYHRAHSLLRGKGPKDQFERWERLVQELDEAHFLDHEGRALGGVIHGESPHTLAREPIVSVRRVTDRVFVETRLDKQYLIQYFEYELREAEVGNWKILRLRDFLHPEDAPFITEKERSRFQKPKVHRLKRLSREEADFDGDRIFASGKSVELDGKVSSIDVREVGFLNVTTGVLVVGDLGYDPGVLSPVGQRVPPGRYLTEVVVAFDRNAALRVRFSEQRVVAWHPADMGDGGHGVGVDAGNVAIMDVAALMTLKSRDKERAFEVYAREVCARDDQSPNSMMLALSQPNDTAIADSGWGDGRYPVYWGVDANGKPVVLVVDFLLLPRS